MSSEKRSYPKRKPSYLDIEMKKMNCLCSVDSWVGGPSPSVPPSAGILQEGPRLHYSFLLHRPPLNRWPCDGLWNKWLGPHLQQLKLLHSKTHLVVRAHLSIPRADSQLMLQRIWCVRLAEHVPMNYVYYSQTLLAIHGYNNTIIFIKQNYKSVNLHCLSLMRTFELYLI